MRQKKCKTNLQSHIPPPPPKKKLTCSMRWLKDSSWSILFRSAFSTSIFVCLTNSMRQVSEILLKNILNVLIINENVLNQIKYFNYTSTHCVFLVYPQMKIFARWLLHQFLIHLHPLLCISFPSWMKLSFGKIFLEGYRSLHFSFFVCACFLLQLPKCLPKECEECIQLSKLFKNSLIEIEAPLFMEP